MKLRLTGRGFEDYTGQMGVIYFQNGVSINDVLPVDGMRIAGTIGAVWENGSVANVGEIYAQNLQTPAPTSLQQKRNDYLASVVGITDASEAISQTNLIANAQFKATGIDVEQTHAAAEAISESFAGQDTAKSDEKYTREDLEAVVEKEGLSGLRTIGNALNVKAGSINDLIDRILEVAGKAEAE